jgi:post-segregation antitoxin (ccd killing protein)
MPRVQVYLPDDLYRQLKERSLPASELLQEAVRSEIQRQVLLEAVDEYVQNLANEVGEPSAEAMARAEAIADRISRHQPASQAS